MANATGDDGTFGKTLMKFITNRLPYQSYSTVTPLDQLNPKYKEFAENGSKRIEALQRQSISASTLYNNTPIPGLIDSYKDAYLYANIQQDKASRLGDYRVMAAFSEISNCLDQICDEIINKDADGNIVKLELKNKKHDFSEKSLKIINDEFYKFIQLFDLDYSGWEYFRQLLIEGEIFFEHVIHKDYPEAGILGILKIPTELIDPIFTNVQNHVVKGYLLRKPVFDPKNPQKIEKFEFIPMDINQVTYINSGIWNENKTLRLPYIENSRRAYRQLSLIEDSIVIYRLVRAPERLVFNVDTGNLPAPQAESYLKKLQQMYWKKFTYDPQGGGTVTKFSPQAMLDSFWFAKRTGSEGTSVTSLPAGANLGELADLMYFVKKLYQSLKVPVTRLNPEDAFKDGLDILREELKFANFLIRQQQRFAMGLKNGFITHLKLKQLWTKLELKEQDIDIIFNVPTNFYEMRAQQKLELKLNNFGTATQNEFISKLYGMKKYLGWSDEDIKANREFLRKDKELQWELEQIAQGGPNWRASYQAAAPAAGGAAEGGGATPPGFGPTPPGMGGAEGEVAPEGEVPAPEGETPAPAPGGAPTPAPAAPPA